MKYAFEQIIVKIGYSKYQKLFKNCHLNSNLTHCRYPFIKSENRDDVVYGWSLIKVDYTSYNYTPCNSTYMDVPDLSIESLAYQVHIIVR